MSDGWRGRCAVARLLCSASRLRKSPGRDRGDAATERCGLEPRRSGGLHGRLRQRLAGELCLGRPRAVRLAEAVRPVPDHLLRAGQDPRLAHVRRGARAPPHPRSRTLHRALRVAARRLGDRERTVHAPTPEAWKSVADSARPHVVGSQVPHRASRITHPGLLLLICTLASCGASSDGVIALEGATLIDGSGGEPIKDALVLVQHGHIQAVARVNEIRVPRGAQVVNLIGKTIIPGLIDAHAHVERWAAQRYLAWGVTTVRDLGASSTDSSIALKNDFDLGSVLGPRMLTSGAMIDGPGPTYATATAVRTAPEVRRAVDLRAVAGAEHVKIYTKLTADLLAPLLDEAPTLRHPVAADPGQATALRVHEMRSRLGNPTLLSRPGMEDVPASAASVRDVAGLLRRTGWRSAELQAFRRSRARQNQFVREFKRAGGLVAAGSDAANQ